LKPADIDEVIIQPDGKKALVKMDDSQKPIAIGKGASNIRLASQICGLALEVV
jgi:transcription antitermination factor NusA-like protein